MCLLVGIFLGILLSAPVFGQPSKGGDFPTHEIKYTVQYSPGGGWDTLARYIAPLMAENLPKKVPIVIRNISGGQGMIGINTLYTSPPDGYTIGCVSSGNVMGQMVGKANYDMRRFNWLGIMSSDYYMTAASHKSGFKKLKDLQDCGREVLVGTSGLATLDGLAGMAQGKHIGYKVKPIVHKGSNEAMLAAARGDVDIITYPFGTVRKMAIDSNELVPLWVSFPERPRGLNVPTLNELGFQKLSSLLCLHRLVGTPPKIPEDRLKILRQAFQAVIARPGFDEILATKFDSTINRAGQKEIETIVNECFTMLEPYKDVIASAWQ